MDKLEYLEDLGVDVLWLTPVYDSPLTDMGYDIRDYENFLIMYGTLEDWHWLLDGLHKRRMRLIMDLVVNYTSSEVRLCRLRRPIRDT
jgi:oligo-1,6-glucosidase